MGSRRTLAAPLMLVLYAVAIAKARRRSVFSSLERDPAAPEAWIAADLSVRFGAALIAGVVVLPGVSWSVKALLMIPALALSIWVADLPGSRVGRGRLRLEGEVEAQRANLGLAPMERRKEKSSAPLWWLAAWLAPLGFALGYCFPGLVGLDDGSPRAALVRQLSQGGYDARDLDDFTTRFLEAWSASDRAALESWRHPDARARLPFGSDHELPAVHSAKFAEEAIDWDHERTIWHLQTRAGPFELRIVPRPDGLAWR